mgnify:CR=1
MSKQDYTHLTILIDTSSSMSTSIRQVKQSTLALLTDQAALGKDLTISLGIFPDRHNHRNGASWGSEHHFLTPEEAKQVVSGIQAAGGTPMCDAIGNVATTVAQKIFSMAASEQPEKILFAIITDGEEGHSRQYNLADIARIVTHHEDTYSWEFLYIGSNQNAYDVGKEMGIKAGKALSFASSTDGLAQAMSAVSASVLRFRQNGAPHANQFFSSNDHNAQAALGASSSPISG